MENAPHRRRDVLASNLLFATLVLSFGALLIPSYLPHPPPRIYTLGSVTMLTTVYLLRGLLYYAIRLGKQWAKYVLLAGFLFDVVAAIIIFTNPLMQLLATRPEELVPVLIEKALIMLALVLLFKKPTLQVA
ncbi:hypothetical protein JAO77_00170 [Hymenobacter sp. BT559]|nr:hypothetical protein [Hymenobacter sp. BT559]